MVANRAEAYLSAVRVLRASHAQTEVDSPYISMTYQPCEHLCAVHYLDLFIQPVKCILGQVWCY